MSWWLDGVLRPGRSATQRGGDPARLQVISQEGQQLFRAEPVVSRERHVVDAAGPEPGPAATATRARLSWSS